MWGQARRTTIRPRRLTSERPASRSLDNRAASRPGVRRLLTHVARAFVFALPATGRSCNSQRPPEDLSGGRVL